MLRVVGELEFSNPVAFKAWPVVVDVENTDSGSSPCIWLEIIQTLLQDTLTIAR